MIDEQFLLKTTPPRVGRAAAVRPRLERRWAEVHDRTAIVVTAPQGFGKTTLMAQWRRNWLERGACVAWASLDAQDDRARFVELLFFALRNATGRESFAAAAAQSRMQGDRELEALTTLLAETALHATQTVVILDDAHRMPQGAMRELLAYLVNNAPPNLHFLIGTRRALELQLTDLMAAGGLATLDASELRFELEESRELLNSRFGRRMSLDDAVRLHDVTEGWPLGLQLAASTVERSTDLHEVIGQLSARRGDIQRFFLESLMSRMSAEHSAFLVRISILEVVNAELCAAVTGSSDAALFLERLADDSPMVIAGDDREWLRLHSMARDFFLGQFDRLPAEERRTCYEHAAKWYAEHGQFRDAARHALAAGNDALAVAHAAVCLQDMAQEGRLTEARDWLKRLPSSIMARDVRLQLTAAWITALGSDAASVPALIEGISQHPQFDENFRFHSALIMAAAAIYSDKPGQVADALRGWECPPPAVPELHALALENSLATLALHMGDTEQVRRRLAHALTDGRRPASLRLVLGYSDLLVGTSYLLEGSAARTVALLQPRLESAEREMGRRSAVAAMTAGVLAGAQLVLGRIDQARATLADRLDVIERAGSPDSLMIAYRTLSGIALQDGDEARALEILEGLREFGVTRNLPRAVLMSLMEQVRLHALRGRVETASSLLMQLEALEPVFSQPDYEPFRASFRLLRGLAAGYTAIARRDFQAAESALRDILELPAHLHRHPLVLVARALSALTAGELGRPEAGRMLEEALGLADLAGLGSYVAAAHPRLSAIMDRRRGASADAGAAQAPAPARANQATPAPSGLLTPKEAHILSLLAAGKANKEIARAMDIGEQTVKWHLKNIFSKLDAANRKHAVDRARLLGLLHG